METVRKQPALREKVLPFQMYWDALHCLRKMLLTMERAPGEVSEEARRARRRGKILENARAADTEQERESIIDAGLERCETDDERQMERERLEEMLDYAELLDEKDAGGENRVTEKQVQFKHLDPRTGWVLPAKPDEVQYDFDQEYGGAVIRIIDEKSGGRMTQKIKENLFFFGLVVSLIKEEERRLAEVADREAMRKREAEQRKQYHGNRGRGQGKRGAQHGGRSRGNREWRFELRDERKRDRPPAIVLVAKLVGKVRDDSTGTWKNAPQPEPMRYARKWEREQLDTVRRVIAKIERAFETGEFPATGSFECNRCPFSNGCEGFASWQAKRNAISTRANVPGPGSGKVPVSLPVLQPSTAAKAQ